MAPLTLQQELKSAADLMRLGRDGEGNAAFARVIERLQAELGALDSAALAPLFPTFEAIVAAQQRGDLLFVADLLEFELGKMLIET